MLPRENLQGQVSVFRVWRSSLLSFPLYPGYDIYKDSHCNQDDFCSYNRSKLHAHSYQKFCLFDPYFIFVICHHGINITYVITTELH